MRILLVEDDQLIGDGIKAGLSHHGFTVDWCEDGLAGELALKNGIFDAVVLDLSLPGKDGLEILTGWRQAGYVTPVLILTARDALPDRVSGLNKGADDYLAKPFALEELTARLRALIRRSGGQPSPTLEYNGVTLHQESRTVTHNGAEVNLSPREVALLELFLLSKDRVLTKSLIEEKLYAWGEEVSSNAVEVHIHHLRKKLGNGIIKTVHRVGYKLGEKEKQA